MMTDIHEMQSVSAGRRLASMILDHFIMTFIAVGFFIPAMINGFAQALSVSHEPVQIGFMNGIFLAIGLLGFVAYFCKDIVNGRSPAKRILKLQVIDNNTGQAASPLKCLLRNITIVIWPIEVIVAITNTNNRLGDRLAGTQLINFDPSYEQAQFNVKKALLPAGIVWGLLLLCMQLIQGAPAPAINYRKTSYNQNKSRELENLLKDSLGQYMIPDIRIYDTVEKQKTKYISTIINLKDNYIEDDDSFRQLNMATQQLIYSKFPKPGFTGQVKYVYKYSGGFSARTIMIGTPAQ